MLSRIFRPRTLVLAIVLLILAAFSFGFANTNTINPTYAGDGSVAVSGYTITVTWTLDPTDPTEMDSASLAFAAGTPGTVRISLDGGATWLGAGTCTAANPSVCTFAAGTLVTGITNIQIVATD
jgi:hypothetical protein